MSEQSTKLRGLVGRLHRRMAPPPVRILESALSLLDHRVLVALCDAGVPDALERPTTIDDLATATTSDRDRLERLVRYAAARGWLKLDRQGRACPNAMTAFLRADHPAGWRAWVDFVGGAHVVGAVAGLDMKSSDCFASQNGRPFFEWLTDNASEWASFDAAMAAGGRMHGLMLDSATKWKTTRRVCDVGGGTGELARTLLDRHPDWHAAVFDLPGVVERAVQHPRLTAVGGDMFASVPKGYDTYLLANVLHDWSDHDAVKILSNIARANSTPKVLVVENIRRRTPRDDLALRADILMAALTDGGRERTRAEFGALAQQAGFELVGARRLASGDCAMELRTRAHAPSRRV